MRFESAKPGGKPLVIEELLERDVKVLAVSEEAVTRVEVTYGKVTTSVSDGGEAVKRTDDSRSGKDYLLSLELGELAVTADGKAVDEDVSAAMTSEHVILDLPFPLPSLLPDTPLAPGDDFDLPHDLVLALFPIDPDGDFDVTRVKLVFNGANGGKTAAFTVETRFWGAHNGRRIELDLKGKLSARLPTAWPEKLSLEGPAKLLANPDDNPASVRTGRAKIEVSSTYQ